MNLLDALREDQTPAGRAALHDYLLDNDVPEQFDESLIIENVRKLLYRACVMDRFQEERVRLSPIVEARVANTQHHASVTFYVHGKRTFRIGQNTATFNGGVYDKAKWAVKALRCDTVKRILSTVKA